MKKNIRKTVVEVVLLGMVAWLPFMALYVARASYLKWKRATDEVQIISAKLNDSLKKLDELTIPQLKAKIRQITFGSLTPHANISNQMIILWVEITNRGAESSATDYALQIGSSAPILPAEFEGILHNESGKDMVKFQRQDQLHEVTKIPIRKGEVRYGILAFNLTPEQSRLIAERTKITLRFLDYLGRKGEDQWDLKTGCCDSPIHIFPGVASRPDPRRR